VSDAVIATLRSAREQRIDQILAECQYQPGQLAGVVECLEWKLARAESANRDLRERLTESQQNAQRLLRQCPAFDASALRERNRQEAQA
jgi:hypothetical protein